MIKIGFSYDCVFWCGDLNFRLEQTRAEIIRFLTFLLLILRLLLMDQSHHDLMDLSDPQRFHLRDIDEGVSVMETDQLG